ncbi:MAG TPA: hypothetical protein DIT64_21025 [Verrucomicrobiales bacterium]|nr:hypothetical protein [Verrucomicrobiales bacterium]
MSARPLNIFVDVDDTLVRSASSKRIPIPSVVAHVRELHAQGAVLYCWSAGGAEYARATAEEMRISECFQGFLPKPNVMIDDQQPHEWPQTIVVHPQSCASQQIKDYAETILDPKLRSA